MRLWSIHPKYLDSKGLVATWREALLAKKVLQGKTKGYRHHPELERFKQMKEPVKAIGKYLYYIEKEASKRGYKFDRRKIGAGSGKVIQISKKRALEEFAHLKRKLKVRSPECYSEIRGIKQPELHALFRIE